MSHGAKEEDKHVRGLGGVPVHSTAHHTQQPTHLQTLVQWINSRFEKEGIRVENLEKDLCDGVIIAKLVDGMTPNTTQTKKEPHTPAIGEGKKSGFKDFLTKQKQGAPPADVPPAFKAARQVMNLLP